MSGNTCFFANTSIRFIRSAILPGDNQKPDDQSMRSISRPSCWAQIWAVSATDGQSSLINTYPTRQLYSKHIFLVPYCLRIQEGRGDKIQNMKQGKH
jgi:hypothetical protein